MAKKSTTQAAAKTGNIANSAASSAANNSKSFEDRLERLEKLGEQIRKSDIPLDEALKAFEEGIRLAKTLERDLEKIENRIEVLMNSTEAPVSESPELELFNDE